jgi:pyruvate/2-oxoglutarate dehydrogenase complex dihydrolipoamide dehydrogenase (E3) component
MREDEEISSAAREVLEAEGVQVFVGTRDLALSGGGDGFRLRFEAASGPVAVGGSHLLIASGRRPNTDDLGLDRAGVATDARGYIQVDDKLRTNVPHIWALGDCNGRGAFTHTSYNDYEIVTGNLLRGEDRSVNDRVTAYALYIDPPLGRAGMTEAEARQAGRRVLVARMPMSDVARAIERSETAGLMKLVADADTKQLLGAAILGTEGDEVVHCIIDLIQARAPYTVLQRTVHIHPTVAEYWPVLAGKLEG